MSASNAPAATTPDVPSDTMGAYQNTLENRDGFIEEDSPLRPRRARMPIAVWVVGILTSAAFFGGLGYALGAAIHGG